VSSAGQTTCCILSVQTRAYNRPKLFGVPAREVNFTPVEWRRGAFVDVTGADSTGRRFRALAQSRRVNVPATVRTRNHLRNLGRFRSSSEGGRLQPDLILIDIGLPTLNGLEAARRIHALSPRSKIIIVTQEKSADVFRQAFRAGANGYVVKGDVRTELLTAIDVVLRGGRFVGCRFASLAMPEPNSPPTERSHEVGFYSDDRFLSDHLTQFIGNALKEERAAIVVATESHRNSLLLSLQGYGVNFGAAIEGGRFVVLDAAEIKN